MEGTNLDDIEYQYWLNCYSNTGLGRGVSGNYPLEGAKSRMIWARKGYDLSQYGTLPEAPIGELTTDSITKQNIAVEAGEPVRSPDDLFKELEAKKQQKTREKAKNRLQILCNIVNK